MMKVSHICAYPVKSAAGVSLRFSRLTQKGLEQDRHWALIGADNEVITAREFPQLLALKPEFTSDGLSLEFEGAAVLNIPYSPDNTDVTRITVFKNPATAVVLSDAINTWFSDYLHISCRLVYMDAHCHRDVLFENGGKEGDVVAYADECPILLLTEASLEDLNARLEQPVTYRNFRPNLVVQGSQAFAEDDWQSVQIGECEFEVGQRCQRCVLTTIDPDTQIKHKSQEPLRTLSTYRRHPAGGVAFGIHLIPRRLGTIRLGDSVEALA